MNKAERNALAKITSRVPAGGQVVEIGSWTGGSSEIIAKKLKDGVLYCVDTWDYNGCHAHPKLIELAEGRDIFTEFNKRMRKYHPITIKAKSLDAVNGFEDKSVDMVFLDGDHSYSGLMADLNAWVPKIKVKGIICGHDYGREEYGVTEAVNEYFGKPIVVLPARSIWVVYL